MSQPEWTGAERDDMPTLLKSHAADIGWLPVTRVIAGTYFSNLSPIRTATAPT